MAFACQVAAHFQALGTDEEARREREREQRFLLLPASHFFPLFKVMVSGGASAGWSKRFSHKLSSRDVVPCAGGKQNLTYEEALVHTSRQCHGLQEEMD